VCCSVLQCVAVRCSVLQCVAVTTHESSTTVSCQIPKKLTRHIHTCDMTHPYECHDSFIYVPYYSHVRDILIHMCAMNNACVYNHPTIRVTQNISPTKKQGKIPTPIFSLSLSLSHTRTHTHTHTHAHTQTHTHTHTHTHTILQ